MKEEMIDGLDMEWILHRIRKTINTFGYCDEDLLAGQAVTTTRNAWAFLEVLAGRGVLEKDGGHYYPGPHFARRTPTKG